MRDKDKHREREEERGLVWDEIWRERKGMRVSEERYFGIKIY